MPKVTLDMGTFKALASDTRLDILRTLDGKKMSLKDISKATKLNKATLHEHLSKLHEAGLVKRKEREGHKWVYYKLSWKGEGLLHPENTRIVVLFTTTFVTLFFGIVMLVNYVKGYVVGKAVNLLSSDSTLLYEAENNGFNFIPQPTHLISFSSDAIAEIPLANQTTMKLSNALLENITYRGILQQGIKSKSLDWEFIANSAEEAKYAAGEWSDSILGDAVPGVSSEMFAIVHDPALQYIAVGCIVLFTILLTIGIWRLWKNKQPKL
jgi:DNA-binding transcriptional ArsR family regulator